MPHRNCAWPVGCSRVIEEGKAKKISDIREYTDEELVKGLEDAQREYLNLRIQAKTGQLENTARMRLVRRDIARIRSIENERRRDTN